MCYYYYYYYYYFTGFGALPDRPFSSQTRLIGHKPKTRGSHQVKVLHFQCKESAIQPLGRVQLQYSLCLEVTSNRPTHALRVYDAKRCATR